MKRAKSVRFRLTVDRPRTMKVMKRANRVSLTDSGLTEYQKGDEEGKEGEFD